MLDIKKSIEQGFSGKPGGLYDILKELQLFTAGIQGEVYFVDKNNGYDGNDGKSWKKSFKTLAVAVAASHANIAAGSWGWDSRNTIFIRGHFTEVLTTLPQKTDIIGVGTVDDVSMARITGTHIIPTPGTAYIGTHFYNIQFADDGASSNWTITNQSGTEFHNCIFKRTASGTYGITEDGCARLKFVNCQFLPDSQGGVFTTAAIKLSNVTETTVQIINCIIYGAIGIDCDATNAVNCLVKNCFIKATTLCIDDESDDLVIVGNRMVSAANQGTIGLVLDYNAFLAVDNILTGSGGTIHCPAETA